MSSALPALPPRAADGHKGTFGTVAVVGGTAAPPRLMIGGPAFTARAALRTGSGLAVLAVPAPLVAAALSITPEATGLALPVETDGTLDASGAAEVLDHHLTGRLCLAVGPGLGTSDSARRIVLRLLARDLHPLVVDADAINVLADAHELQSDLLAPAVFTPHPGEYQRLARVLGLDADPTDPAARPAAAEMLARKLGAIVVLKGPGTVISDGQRTTINATGSAALATAGSGDVLTGIIASLIAQFALPLGAGALDLYDCAVLGVHLHGAAADAWCADHGAAGLLASDLMERIPAALHALREA